MRLLDSIQALLGEGRIHLEPVTSHFQGDIIFGLCEETGETGEK